MHFSIFGLEYWCILLVLGRMRLSPADRSHIVNLCCRVLLVAIIWYIVTCGIYHFCIFDIFRTCSIRQCICSIVPLGFVHYAWVASWLQWRDIIVCIVQGFQAFSSLVFHVPLFRLQTLNWRIRNWSKRRCATRWSAWSILSKSIAFWEFCPFPTFSMGSVLVFTMYCPCWCLWFGDRLAAPMLMWINADRRWRSSACHYVVTRFCAKWKWIKGALWIDF